MSKRDISNIPPGVTPLFDAGFVTVVPCFTEAAGVVVVFALETNY